MQIFASFETLVRSSQVKSSQSHSSSPHPCKRKDKIKESLLQYKTGKGET